MQTTIRERVLIRWMNLFGPSARYGRLEGELSASELELRRRIEPKQEAWAVAADQLLQAAREALARHQLDKTWRLLQAARRMELFAPNNVGLESRAVALRSEAEKLVSWRRNAVERLLGTCKNPELKISPAAVYEATLIRDDHYGNVAYKDRLVRMQILTLVISLLAVLVSLAIVLSRSPDITPRLQDARYDDLGGLSTVVTVVLFGLLGGTVSAMVRVSDTGQSARIPELTAAIRVTFMRLAMGGASALVVFVLLRSDLASAIGKQFLSTSIVAGIEKLQPLTAYTVAFVAGFSEHFVTRAIEKIAGSSDDKSKGKAGM